MDCTFSNDIVSYIKYRYNVVSICMHTPSQIWDYIFCCCNFPFIYNIYQFYNIWVSFSQECFVLSLFNIGSLVFDKKIFKFQQYIFDICNYLPFEEGQVLRLNQLNSPYPRMFCVMSNVAQWFWRRRWKYEKFTDRQTDRQTDEQLNGSTVDGRPWKLPWAFSLLE